MQTFFEQAQSRLKTSTRPFQFRVRFFSQSRWKLNRTETWIAVNDNWISVNVVYVRDSELISSSRFFIQGVVWWWFCAGCVILNCKWAYFFEVKTTRKLDQQWFNQKKDFLGTLACIHLLAGALACRNAFRTTESRSSIAGKVSKACVCKCEASADWLYLALALTMCGSSWLQ